MLGITQEELAKRMGYKSKSTINKIEKWRNVNPNVIRQAFNGYSFGRTTNIFLHSLSQPSDTINNLINEGKKAGLNFLFK